MCPAAAEEEEDAEDPMNEWGAELVCAWCGGACRLPLLLLPLPLWPCPPIGGKLYELALGWCRVITVEDPEAVSEAEVDVEPEPARRLLGRITNTPSVDDGCAVDADAGAKVNAALGCICTCARGRVVLAAGIPVVVAVAVGGRAGWNDRGTGAVCAKVDGDADM